MNNAQVLRDALTGAIAATGKDTEILGLPGDQHHNTLPKMVRCTRGAWTFMAMLQRHEGV